MNNTIETEILAADAPGAFEKALELLRRGQVIGIPTDTVYGVAADGFDAAAVERLFAAKDRPRDKPIPLLLAEVDDLDLVGADIPGAARKLVAEFWPGGLTVVVRARANVPAVLLADGNSVAVRLPDHALPRRLARQLGRPLAATSANLSGGCDPATAGEVAAQLGGRIPLILDGGAVGRGAPSTVIDFSVTPPRLRRLGALPPQAIERVLGEKISA